MRSHLLYSLQVWLWSWVHVKSTLKRREAAIYLDVWKVHRYLWLTLTRLQAKTWRTLCFLMAICSSDLSSTPCLSGPRCKISTSSSTLTIASCTCQTSTLERWPRLLPCLITRALTSRLMSTLRRPKQVSISVSATEITTTVYPHSLSRTTTNRRSSRWLLVTTSLNPTSTTLLASLNVCCHWQGPPKPNQLCMMMRMCWYLVRDSSQRSLCHWWSTANRINTVSRWVVQLTHRTIQNFWLLFSWVWRSLLLFCSSWSTRWSRDASVDLKPMSGLMRTRLD